MNKILVTTLRVMLPLLIFSLFSSCFDENLINDENLMVRSSSMMKNLALNKKTRQSSTAHGGSSSRAVDGNSDGNFFKKTVTLTASESSPWWQVDLDDSYFVYKVTLWNRTDCCRKRLRNFHVDLLDKDGNVLATRDYKGTAPARTDIDITANGVFSVRVVNGSSILSLAEVQVWGVSTDTYNGPFVKPYNFSKAAPWYLAPNENSFPANATIITALDKAIHKFKGDGKRDIEAEVEFPSETHWKQVGILIRLECPPGEQCDAWDRLASIGLMEPTGEPGKFTGYEIARYVTPYRKGFSSYTDITPMAHKLVGKKIITSHINTWSDKGWAVTVKFVFYPGKKKTADQVINIWGMRNIQVGDPQSLEDSIDPVTVSIPADAKKVEAKLIATGHGFGYTKNCAEFCQMRQDLIINGTTYSVNEWRDDCASNPVSNQAGTWKSNRNGWCPGSVSVGSTIDITRSIAKGKKNIIDFNILLSNGSDYINTSTKSKSPYELVSLKLYIYK